MSRIFLTLVGAAYLILALWCSISPEKTSRSIGFTRQSGAGESEFLTVYGGLQFALGLAFLWPWVRTQDLPLALGLCVVVHGSLVLFRTISFALYRGIPSTTWIFAGLEWVLFLAAALLLWKRR